MNASKTLAVLLISCLLAQPVLALETAELETIPPPVPEMPAVEESLPLAAPEEPEPEPEAAPVPIAAPAAGTTTEATTTPDAAPREEASAEPSAELPSEPLAPEPLPPGEYVPGEILVKFKEQSIDLERASGEAKAEAIAEAQDLEITESIESANVAVVDTQGASLPEAIAAIEADPNVEYAEPNFVYTIDAISTNDTHRGLLWALENTGQAVTVSSTTGTADADIDAPEAWTVSKGGSVIVAVIDTGVDYTHPDLSANMWDGSSCVSDIGAPLGNCVHGYDFSGGTQTDGDEDLDPTPTLSNHGTHVAGTIAAVMDNSRGVIGVAPEATIMALRADYQSGGSTLLKNSEIIRAINFARENGAKVINASFAGAGFSTTTYQAIEHFGNAGGIFVAAAGNDNDNDPDDTIGNDNDVIPQYPASYDLDNIISVAATDQSDVRTGFSNYGPLSVDVGAPGDNILSTGTSSVYVYKDGTSMAAPHVAGIAAQLMALNPALTVAQVKGAILSTGDSVPSLATTTVTGKRVNAFKALSSVAAGLATSTLTVSVTVVNDNGRTATSSDFGFEVNGGSAQAFEADGSVSLSVTPGFYAVTGVAEPGYALSGNCSSLTLLAASSSSCELTYNDTLDTKPPAITLTGANPQSLTVGNAYAELGATASDDVDGDISGSITIDATNVNMGAAGTYTVVYSVADSAGNSASSTRAVVVSAAPSGGGGGGGGSSKKSESKTKKETVKQPKAKKTAAVPTPKPAAAKPAAPKPAVLGASAYNFANDLGQGSKGNDVIELQKILIAKGHLASAATGYFGPLTAEALRKYQASKALPASGIADAATRAALTAEPGMASGNGSAAVDTMARLAALQSLVQVLLAQLAALRNSYPH